MTDVEMVEVVIKMPKEKYDSICNMYGTFPAKMKEWGLEYIKNGTVLSKGHGDLIDRTELLENKYEIDSKYCEYDEVVNVYDIKDANTIIEADRVESEDKK